MERSSVSTYLCLAVPPWRISHATIISVSRLYCLCVSMSQGGIRALSSEVDILQDSRERAGIGKLRRIGDL